jgi:hypothetical protein
MKRKATPFFQPVLFVAVSQGNLRYAMGVRLKENIIIERNATILFFQPILIVAVSQGSLRIHRV